MSRPTHYVPTIGRHLVCALYHEARHRRQPMTRLVDELLTAALQGTAGWQIAQHPTQPPSDPAASSGESVRASVSP
jgi:hypothetical protein